MSKNRSIADIDFKVQSRRKAGLLYLKEIHAIDTENRPGEPAAILATDYRPYSVHSLDDCLRALTTNKLRGSLNTFWNIDYDIASLFKFEPDILRELYETTTAEYENYNFSYIADRVFTIRKSKKKWSFYDVQQYFKDSTPSLAGAAKKYLNAEADELKGDRDKLFELYPETEIARYCMSDCTLTKNLTEYLCKGLEQINFVPPDLTSVGSVSRKFCIQHSNIPILNYMPSLELIDAYYQAYRGGWFEICKRGRFNAYGYDIVSAYPAITRELPDIRHGDFIEIQYPEDIDGIDEYGVLLVSAKNKKNSIINPLSVKIGSGLFYPVLSEGTNMYITLREYRAFSEIYDFEIKGGWIFRPNVKHPFKPFRKVVDKLYDIKESEKKAGNKGSAMYMTSKLILNSIYGNTIQTTRKIDGTITGGMFNPFYACEITAYCRVRMFEAIKKQLRDVIMIATDGVYTSKRLKNIELSSALGGWEEEHTGDDAVFIGSGIYQFSGEDSKGRGIGRVNFFDLLTRPAIYDINGSPVLKINRTKRIKVKEAIVQNRIQDVNKFENITKELKLNGEISNRRDWNKEPVVFEDLLNNQYSSNAHFSALLRANYAHRMSGDVEPFSIGSWNKKFILKKVID